MALFGKLNERMIQKKANAFIATLKGKSDSEVESAYLKNTEFHNNEIVLSYIFFNHNELIKILPKEFQFNRINSNLTMFKYGSSEVKKELVSNWIHNNKLFNNSLVIGFTDEEFNEYCKMYFNQHEDLTILHMEDLKRIVTILNNYDSEETEKIISELKDKFVDRQWEFIIEVNPVFIKYASQAVQNAHKNEELYANYLTGEAKEDFLTNKVDLIKNDFTLFEKSDPKVQAEFIKNCPYMINTLSKDVITNILKSDISLLKYVNLSSFKEGEDKTQDFVCNILTDLNEKTNKEIVDILVNKNLLNARGKLYRYDSKSNNISYQYTKKIIKLFQDLKREQIITLIMVDVNYVLPYIVPLYPNNASIDRKKEEIDKSSSRTMLLFQKYYDQKVCSEYIETIDKIYDVYLENIGKYDYENDYRCVLDLFKVLFNKNIIENNDPKVVNSFIDEALKFNKNIDDIIKYKNITSLNELLNNAYKTKVTNNREIYNISSLELFDTKLSFINSDLLDKFSRFNFINVSNLLLIIKSNKALEMFKTYYKYMISIHGENVTTLYKSIENFNNYKSILLDVSDKRLNEKEIDSLVLLLSDYDNKYNITRVEELDNYDMVLYKNLVNEISSAKDESLYKNIICNYLFSKCYDGKSDAGWLEMDTIEMTCNVFDVDALEYLEINNEKVFSENEINLFRMIKLLFSSGDFELLLSFVEKIINNNVKKNSIGVLDFFNKIQKYRVELINNQIVTLEDIKQLLIDRPDLVMKNTKDGVDIYTIVGQDFKVLISENDDGIHYRCEDASKVDKNSYAYDRLVDNGSVRFSTEDNKTMIKLSKDDVNEIKNKVSYIIVVGKLNDELFNIAKKNNLTIVEIKSE